MNRTASIILLLALGAGLPLVERPVRAADATAARPNIVYILCDDLGIGDVHCFNPQGKIKTPSMDRAAKEGMRFTDMHSGSAVCSPTRYGVITGRYAWRSKLQSGVLGGLSPRLIEPGRLTVAELLKQQGYHTACIGKWHLGMDWVKQGGKDVAELSIESPAQVWNVDYSKPFANGPNSVGFEYYFGISASLDMVPYTFLENDHVTVLPTVDKTFPFMEGRESGRTRKGPAAPEFKVTDVLPTLTKKATEYIARQAKAGQPFFLYLPFASPHSPIATAADWQGKSGLNPYADFVMQTDWSIGEVLKALDEHGMQENTLVIITSDNGCSPQAKFEELLAKGHNPNSIYRGHKADIFEGGHRIPFIARWPAKVKAGSESDQTLCLTDLMATCADILNIDLPKTAGEDSVSILPALEGKAEEPLREAVVHHSINGSFAIRQGPWKLVLCRDSGGWSAPRPGTPAAKELPDTQLFNLESDIGETKNVAAEHPDIVAKLTELMEQYIADGRSTPGALQQNTVPVQIRKAVKSGGQGKGKGKGKGNGKGKK